MASMFDLCRQTSMDQFSEFVDPLPFDPFYCDLFMNDSAFENPFEQSVQPLDSYIPEADSPSLASSASSISAREDSDHSSSSNVTDRSNTQSNGQSSPQSTNQHSTASNESHPPNSRSTKRKASPTPTSQLEADKPVKQSRSVGFPACPLTSVSDELRIIHHFTAAIRNILARPSSPYTDADCIYTISQLMEAMRPDLFRQFLTGLGYVSTSAPEPNNAERCIWRSELRLPMVTLPHRMVHDWSRSPQKAVSDEPHSLNIATLVCERPEAVTLHRYRDGFVAVEVGPSKILNDDNIDTSDPIPLDQTDLSSCSIPLSVQVNCAFERLFGYTQQEVRNLFLREGKGALYLLNNRAELHEFHRRNIKGIMEGQTECCWSLSINTKYGSVPLKCLIMMKHFINEASCTMKRLAMWVPLPKD